MNPQLHIQLETKKSRNDSEPRNPEFEKAQTSSDGQDCKIPNHQSALALASRWEGGWHTNLWVLALALFRSHQYATTLHVGCGYSLWITLVQHLTCSCTTTNVLTEAGRNHGNGMITWVFWRDWENKQSLLKGWWCLLELNNIFPKVAFTFSVQELLSSTNK